MNQINQEQINIGNQSALDLLIKQNNAKQELATNLQGLGVNANASTETLEQLVYDVSTVSVDNNRQIPKNIAVDVSNNEEHYDMERFWRGTAIKNGWFFYLVDDNGTIYLRRFKLSSMSLATYNTDKSLSTTNQKRYTNIGSSDSDSGAKRLVFNEDGTHVYIALYNKVVRYIITAESYATEQLSITLDKTYIPQFESGNDVSIYSFDVNANESQMIVVENGTGYAGIFDLTAATGSTTTQVLDLISTDKDALMFMNNANNNFVELYFDWGTLIGYINFYNLINGNLNLIKTEKYMLSATTNQTFGILKYKDTNNNYKIFYHLGNVNCDNDGSSQYPKPTFLMIDCNTTNITPIYSKLNYKTTSHYSNDNAICSPTITIIDNNYYLLAGSWLAVFDSNWNLIGNIINRFFNNIDDNQDLHFLRHTLIYNNEIYDYIYDDDKTIHIMRHKTYLNKLVAYERTVTKTNNNQTYTIQLPYYAQLNNDDLDEGYYNI